MTTLIAAKWLVASGCFAIFLSSWLGVAMLVPHAKGHSEEPGKINFKHIGAAHVDWIILGLMSAASGGMIFLFQMTPPPLVVGLMIFGAWANPLPYVFRAFGINAFRFAGSPLQKFAATLGGLSSAAILVAWGYIFFKLFTSLGSVV